MAGLLDLLMGSGNPGFAAGNALSGWLFGDAPQATAPADDPRAAAVAALAQRMRQQSPLVPPPSDGASPNDRVAGAFDDVTQTPASAIAGPVPLPQARPASADNYVQPSPSGNLAPPPNAMAADQSVPAAPDAAPPPAPAAPSGPSLLDRIGQGITNHSNTLMALGAGLAGAPSLGTGISRGLAAAIPAAQRDLALTQMNQTYAAMIKRGVPEDVARAAVANPAIMQQIIPQLFGPKQMNFTQIGEDMFGNKRYGFVDPVRGTVTPFQGSSPFGAGPNLGQVNSNLIGEDYLKQFPPEVQSAVKDYIGGKSMPTGNPRAGFTQAVKMIAQKYGNDIGMPADDTNFTARRQMRNQLSNAAPNSLGGHINVGNTAIGHLNDLSQKALELDNVGGWGIAPLAHVINAARGITTDQSAKIEALKGAAQHYGQEITKFYAGSPGGEAERDRFLSTVNGAKSPQELAAVLETEAQLMRSRLGAIGSQIHGVLGDAGAAEYPVIRPESEKAFGELSANVSRLRGNTPPASLAAAAPPPRVRSFEDALRLPPGTRFVDPSGIERVR